jgi:acetylornithine/succinyldiaminopimelate/putrescine aminotransferase
VLEVLEHVRAMGDRFAEGFAQLQARYSIVAGWRQRGLMIGFEMADDRLGPLMTLGMAQNGVLAVFANHRPSTLQIMPPLIIQPGEVDFVLEALDKTCSWLMRRPSIPESLLRDLVVQ